MTIYEPNPEVRPTGEEAAEFVDPPDTAGDEGDRDQDAPGVATVEPEKPRPTRP